MNKQAILSLLVAGLITGSYLEFQVNQQDDVVDVIDAGLPELPFEAVEPSAPVVEGAEESGEDINVRLEGVRRDYPAYRNNIIRQINNCFRPPGDGRDWVATVLFYIVRDGSVEGLEFATRSGSFDFDFSAMGAVECAGIGRFGPLPDDLPYDRLPVQFEFKPGGETLSVLPGTATGAR